MCEDWDLLLSFFPTGWRDIAVSVGALKGLRKDKSAEHLLHTLLIHVGCGHSLRETVVRAKKANLADLSDVALLKRLRKSREWLREMCIGLFREQGVELSSNSGDFQIRAFDATTVKEPGKTGSLWRIHYSVRIPSLCCDFFKVTETEGPDTGESLRQFPICKDDYILADRGYSTPSGICYAHSNESFVTVRVNTSSLPFHDGSGNAFDLLKAVGTIRKAGSVGVWPVIVAPGENEVQGRLCAIRKTEHAIALAHQKIRREATRKNKSIRPETLEYAKYVILFSTYPVSKFSAAEILEWYRIRWQVELVFKRFKSLAQFGHLPKHDDDSSKAWIYGKLFVALLIEKLISHAEFVSPWGCHVEEQQTQKRVA